MWSLPGNVRSPGYHRRATPYTREGAAAHEVAERAVHGLPIPDEIIVDGEAVEVSQEMLENIEVYVDYVESLRKSADVFLTEERIRIDGLPEPVFGTADCIVYWREKQTVEIPDLKYGKGVLVDARDNPQLRLYGLGAARRLIEMGEKVKRVRMTIVQPRTNPGLFPFEEIPLPELEFWAIEELHPALLSIAMDDQTENTGEHCRWCVRAGECAALANLAQVQAVQAFAPDPKAEIEAMDDASLGLLLDRIELVTTWVSLVRAEATHRAETEGKVIPGWKLAPKRAVRKWDDQDAVMAKLTQMGVVMNNVVKLVSPAAVERELKSLKKSMKPLDSHVVKESSGNTLVKSSDPREESLALTPKVVFNDNADSLLETEYPF